jgi:hypothetical protein
VVVELEEFDLAVAFEGSLEVPKLTIHTGDHCVISEGLAIELRGVKFRLNEFALHDTTGDLSAQLFQS